MQDAAAKQLSLATTATSTSDVGPLTFHDVYRDWFVEVTRFVRALGGPPADLEDLAQDVFVVVERKLSTFDGKNLGGWLYAIARNTVSDYRRRAWFRRVFAWQRETGADEHPSTANGPLEQLEKKHAQRLVQTLAAKLHVSRRDTFLLFELEGYSGEEIAKLLAIPIATVWTRLHLARKEFLAAATAFREQEGRGR